MGSGGLLLGVRKFNADEAGIAARVGDLCDVDDGSFGGCCVGGVGSARTDPSGHAGFEGQAVGGGDVGVDHERVGGDDADDGLEGFDGLAFGDDDLFHGGVDACLECVRVVRDLGGGELELGLIAGFDGLRAPEGGELGLEFGAFDFEVCGGVLLESFADAFFLDGGEAVLFVGGFDADGAVGLVGVEFDLEAAGFIFELDQGVAGFDGVARLHMDRGDAAGDSEGEAEVVLGGGDGGDGGGQGTGGEGEAGGQGEEGG